MSDEDVVLRIVREEVEADRTMGGMAFVPTVVARAVAKGLRVLPAQQALLGLARSGSIELRPETGMGRLTHDESDLCPQVTDPMTRKPLPLSWARLR